MTVQRMTAQKAILWLCLTVSGIATGAIFWQWYDPPQAQRVIRPASAPNVPTTSATSPQPFQLPPMDQYDAIITRPLFITTRRPEPPPPEEPAAPPPPEKSVVQNPEQKFSLMGVLIAPHNTVALLRPEEQPAQSAQTKTARVKLGDTVGEWRLETVLPGRVVLRKGDKTQELALVRPKKSLVRRPTPKAAPAQTPATPPPAVPHSK